MLVCSSEVLLDGSSGLSSRPEDVGDIGEEDVFWPLEGGGHEATLSVPCFFALLRDFNESLDFVDVADDLSELNDPPLANVRKAAAAASEASGVGGRPS